MFRWKEVIECRDDEGEVNCWSLTEPTVFIWISRTCEGYFNVEEKVFTGHYIVLHSCKSLRAAKDWVRRHFKERIDG